MCRSVVPKNTDKIKRKKWRYCIQYYDNAVLGRQRWPLILPKKWVVEWTGKNILLYTIHCLFLTSMCVCVCGLLCNTYNSPMYYSIIIGRCLGFVQYCLCAVKYDLVLYVFKWYLLWYSDYSGLNSLEIERRKVTLKSTNHKKFCILHLSRIQSSINTSNIGPNKWLPKILKCQRPHLFQVVYNRVVGLYNTTTLRYDSINKYSISCLRVIYFLFSSRTWKKNSNPPHEEMHY